MRNTSTSSLEGIPSFYGDPKRSTQGSQTLERGLLLLRAFLGGAPDLTNAELAQRCGLPRSTVSRLTHTLVDGGFLEHDPVRSVYRLAPVCLSFAAGYHHGHEGFSVVMPLLLDTARREKINVGLGLRDGAYMVYLASFREEQGPVRRVVNPGFRSPIEGFASGHALIAALPLAERKRLLEHLAKSHGAAWPAMRERIEDSIAQCAKQGYCIRPSTPGLYALATTVHAPDGTLCTVILSAHKDEALSTSARDLPRVLLGLAREMKQAWGVA